MHLLVEILRADGWRKLTTIRPQSGRGVSHERARDLAEIEAERCLRGWRDYFGSNESLRINPIGEGW